MYVALYRKYRPITFDDVISQEHITTTLKNQVASGQTAHAYLFTGTRGTGKTTCAKIMARAVNCLSPKNGNPCGECAACKAIREGSTDIIEIDAASNNGVDSIRQIRDEVIYSPIDCKYKVYIIDEVHMLSGAAFNALLKTLEEPPSHAVFILATTEYYKVPATILSRCQQFLFSKIDPDASAKRLLEIAGKEGVSLSPGAAGLIARLSDGAMRDALSILDQCVCAGSEIDEALVRKCVGVADSSYLFGISQAAIAQKPADALKILDELITQGKDLSRFVEEMTLHYRNLMLTKTVPDSGLVAASDRELKQYSSQCGQCSADEIMRCIDLVSDSLDSINRMKQTGQARLLAETLLIRLCSPEISNDTKSLAARLGALENKLAALQQGNALNIRQRPVHDETEKTVSGSENSHEAPPPFPVGQQLTDEKPSLTKAAAPDTLVSSEEIPFPEKAAAPDKLTLQEELPLPEEPPLPEEFSLPPEPAEQEPVLSEEIPLPEEPPMPAEYFSDEGIPPSEEPAPPREPLPRSKPAQREDIKAADISEAKSETKSAAPAKAEEPEAVSSPQQPAGGPVPEIDDLPDGAQPLPQWSEIVKLLPAAARGIMQSTQAFLYDGKIFIQAPPSARTQLENGKRADTLREKVRQVMGGSLTLFALKERPYTEEQKEDKVTPFLEKARAMGIDVTTKEK